MKMFSLNKSLEVNIPEQSDTSQKDVDNWFIYAKNGNLVEIRKLIDKNIDVNIVNSIGNTALMISSMEPNTIEVTRELLLQPNIDVNKINIEGLTALIYSSVTQINNVVNIKELLNSKGINIDIKDVFGYDALLIAMEYKNYSSAFVLLEYGANINIQDNGGYTPLMIIMFDDELKLSVMKELLKYKNLDVNIQDEEGFTALMLAINKHKIEEAKELLKHKSIEVNLKNIYGDSVLFTSIYNCLSEVNKLCFVTELLKHKNINVNITNLIGLTPLMLASSFNIYNKIIDDFAAGIHTFYTNKLSKRSELSIFIVEELLKNNEIDVNIQDKNGLTAIMYSSFIGNVNMINTLAKAYPNINLTDKRGRSAYDIAYLYKNIYH